MSLSLEVENVSKWGGFVVALDTERALAWPMEAGLAGRLLTAANRKGAEKTSRELVCLDRRQNRFVEEGAETESL